MPKVKQQHHQQQKTKRKRGHDNESVAGGGAAAAEVENDGDSHIDIDEGDGDGGDGDGGDDDGDRDGDGGDDGSTVTAEGRAELTAQCSKYVQTHRSIKDLAAQVGVLRKTLKEQEKNLLAVMQNVKLEEVVVDGSKITRSRKLQIFDE